MHFTYQLFRKYFLSIILNVIRTIRKVAFQVLVNLSTAIDFLAFALTLRQHFWTLQRKLKLNFLSVDGMLNSFGSRMQVWLLIDSLSVATKSPVHFSMCNWKIFFGITFIIVFSCPD